MSVPIIPRGEPNDVIYYGEAGLNVGLFGLNSDSFLELHHKITKHGLNIRTPWPELQILFVLYSNELLNLGFDIKVLVSEFNNAQRGDGSDAKHALSLTKLTYHYVTSGHDVIVVKTHPKKPSPDIIINDVKCELKVRLDQTENRMQQHRHLLFDGQHEKYQDLCFSEIHSHIEDLQRGLRVAKVGFRQGECVFLDLSNHFHTWNYHRLASSLNAGNIQGLYTTPVPPAPQTCILFSPDNALNCVNRNFHPRAFWGYLREGG